MFKIDVYNVKIYIHCKMNIKLKTVNSSVAMERGCRCDLGFIIKDHIQALMQMLTNDLPQFNFRMQTTKCLNTAVMLVQFLLGNKGLQIANSCDTRAVISRHSQGMESNESVLHDLKKQLFSKREKTRVLYYILLSDGYFPTQSGTDNRYFPGHVFILEKAWDQAQQKHIYYFYQSYINKYTLREHIMMNKGLVITQERANELMTHLEKVLKSETWSTENVKRWYDMTFADSSNLLNSNSRQRFFLCFRKAKTSVCLEKLEQFLTKHRRRLMKMPASRMDDVYGDDKLYEDTSKALSNKQVLMQVEALLEKIQKSKQKQ